MLLATAACTGVAAAQPQRAAQLSPVARFLISLLVTLVIGAFTLGVAPRFVNRVVGATLDEPLAAGLTGVAVLVIEIFVLFVAALFGPLVILVAIPFVLLGLVGQVIGVVALGSVVVEQFDEPSHWKGLLVGAPLVALTGLLPVLGQVLWFVVSVVGVGAVVRDQGWA